jgi:hypothetical protein
MNMSMTKPVDAPWSAAQGPVGLLMCILVACVFVGTTFSLDFILGASSYWQTESDDITQYVAGFNLYFSAPWQWPLLAFDSLNFPKGTRVTFVDAIPLYALLLKFLVPASWAPFNPFGIWVLLCFVLQAVAAWYLLRVLRINSWAFLLALTLLLIGFPALMARMGHISLMSHWILLFALALYVKTQAHSRMTVTAWTCLLTAAFYVNIYLFVMASGIFGAAWLSMQSPLVLRNWLRLLTPCVVLGLSSLITLFPLPTAEVTSEWGFGYYSMNLLSPWTGGALVNFHVQQGPGQYEGFNYLGLGVIVGLIGALLMTVLLGPIRFLHSVRQHWALVLLFFLYALYALSNQIFWSDDQIAVLPYPAFMNGFTSQFRASGRFFWPVGYGLIIWTLLVWYQHFSARLFSLVFALILALQVADLSVLYQTLRTTQDRSVKAILNTPQWDAALGQGISHIYFYPKFKCGKDPHGTLLPMMKYAAERQLTLNTGYVARYTPDCQDTAQEIAASDGAKSAYVFVKTEFPDMTAIQLIFEEPETLRCQSIQFAHVCRILRPKAQP